VPSLRTVNRRTEAEGCWEPTLGGGSEYGGSLGNALCRLLVKHLQCRSQPKVGSLALLFCR